MGVNQIRRNTIKEKIQVLEELGKGNEVLYTSLGGSKFNSYRGENPNFNTFFYKTKLAPLEIWVNFYPYTGTMDIHKSEIRASSKLQPLGRTVHMREVIED